jgi:phosphoribosylformylglycinamidine synthase II
MEEVNLNVAFEHGLTEEEFNNIIRILGRKPNLTEIGIFSVMWSEHCSYKSSRLHLKNFPTKAEWVIQGPGENAGIIDIGEGLAVAFKMESHNHPSFIEPYQGAATGVGGILRDIFTMGARPIASLNSLRFGEPSNEKTKFLVSGVVEGIADYGNCVGVPTVGGEIYFDKCYNGNILVNVFNLGVVKKDKIFYGYASGVGNPVIYVGSKTGRDGIHGCSLLASEEFSEEAEDKRPTVQVGDPFTEKRLIEACLELMDKDYIVGIQDMGAAGLTSSSVEMAGRAATGITLDLDKIPVRETGMTPYEIMLSESQERMLIVAKKGYEEKVKDIFKKWDLDAVVVGEVTDNGYLTLFFRNEKAAEIPVKPIADEAPVYNRPSEKPSYLDEVQSFDFNTLEFNRDYNYVLETLFSSLNICSKKWVFEQYDHMVRINTVVLPGSDAAVVRIKGTEKAIALTSDCNSRYAFLDPFKGGAIAVCEAARNIACSGGKPLAITDCLNFGNPEKPEIMWQFIEAIKGMSKACEILKTPVVSGNVSFYNETSGTPIYPTPTVGMVGLIDNVNKHITQNFKESGDIIVLIGENREELGGSEYLLQMHNMVKGKAPDIDIELELKTINTILELNDNSLIKSAHDLSEGGLAVGLAECCITGDIPIGATVNIASDIDPIYMLFGESQSRILITCEENKLSDVEKILNKNKLKFSQIGRVGGNFLKINNFIDADIYALKKTYYTSFENYMKG